MPTLIVGHPLLEAYSKVKPVLNSMMFIYCIVLPVSWYISFCLTLLLPLFFAEIDSEMGMAFLCQLCSFFCKLAILFMFDLGFSFCLYLLNHCSIVLVNDSWSVILIFADNAGVIVNPKGEMKGNFLLLMLISVLFIALIFFHSIYLLAIFPPQKILV